MPTNRSNQSKPRRQTAVRRGRARRETRRVVEYMVSGGFYFWSGYVVFFVCDKGLHLDLFWAKTCANLVGWTVNYLLQRYWVFRVGGVHRHRSEVTLRYAVITIVDFVLDYLIVFALKSAGISPYLGQFASAGFFTVWNYAWYRSWVFTSRLHRKHKAVR